MLGLVRKVSVIYRKDRAYGSGLRKLPNKSFTFAPFAKVAMVAPESPALFDWTEQVNRAAQAGERFFFLLDFELRRPRFFVPADWEEEGQIAFRLPGGVGGDVECSVAKVVLTADPILTHRYLGAFELVQRGLRRGDSFLTNLTFPTPITLSGDLAAVYAGVEAKYCIYLPDEFVCFSPETFVTISEEGYIATSPMKGTAEDSPAGRERLLSDPKEVAEHATIVDLLRNDLSQVAAGVRVTDYRYVRAIERGAGGLVQTSSDIGGYLEDNWQGQLGEILLRLLPAGSVSGAPKAATLAIIQQAEDGPRGYYCGVAGYFDGWRLDTCVMIRFIARRGDDYYFHSGGGITALSDWRAEYEELNAKIRLPLRQ